MRYRHYVADPPAETPRARAPCVPHRPPPPSHAHDAELAKTMEAAVDESLSGRKFSLFLLGLFAGVALTLAAVGVYGVMSYGVAQRTREIGIRMALGARKEDVLRLVVGDGFRLAMGGIAIGIALAVGLSRLLRGMRYGVSA